MDFEKTIKKIYHYDAVVMEVLSGLHEVHHRSRDNLVVLTKNNRYRKANCTKKIVSRIRSSEMVWGYVTHKAKFFTTTKLFECNRMRSSGRPTWTTESATAMLHLPQSPLHRAFGKPRCTAKKQRDLHGENIGIFFLPLERKQPGVWIHRPIAIQK